MIISTAQIAPLLNILSHISNKSTLPCLHHIYFTPAGSHVVVTATDLDIYLYWTMEGHLPRPVSAPIEWFLKALRTVKPGGHLELRVDDTTHCLCALPSNAPSLRCLDRPLPIRDMPAFTTAGFTEGGYLSAHTLRNGLRLLPFMSTDETRYVLNGVHFEKSGNVVATDGRRLGFQLTTGSSLPVDLIMPPALLKLLAGSFAKNAPDSRRMAIWTKDTELLATLEGGAMIWAKTIMGNFPNWRQVLPNAVNSKAFVTLNPELLELLRFHKRNQGRTELRVAITLHADATVTVHPYIQKGGAHVGVCDAIPAGTHKGGQSFEIAVNGEFFIEALAYAGNSIRLCDEIAPLVLGDPTQAQMVLMPMRVNDRVAA
jgi:DNA polymerase III sliding clamp (beta) subunit (PCNA family)